MSHQKRIDEFFKVTSSKVISTKVTSAKKTSGIRNTQRSKAKKGRNVKKNLSQSKQALEFSTTTDYSIMCETIIHNNLEDVQTMQSSIYQERSYSDDTFNASSMKRELSPTQNNLENTPKKTPSIPLDLKQALLLDHVSGKYSAEKTLQSPSMKPSPVKTPRNSNSPSNAFKYSPKKSTVNSPGHFTPRKLFGHTIDRDITSQAIEQMNLLKQGAIQPNNFDLEEIYSERTFSYRYSHIDTKTSMKYEVNDIVVPNDMNAKILLTTIFHVLSDPVNCGYFDEDEIDLLYLIVTLSVQAQMLLARMLKRKRAWYRSASINYPDISLDLDSVFKVLVSMSICTSNIKEEALSIMLELLQVDEVRKICRQLKIGSTGNKQVMMENLHKFTNVKPIFAGYETPSSRLTSLILRTLGYCVCVTEKTWNVIDKLMTLLIPNQDSQTSIADLFFMLFDVYQGKIVYPPMPKECFPIFSSKDHLLSYIHAKKTLCETLTYVEKKDWETVRRYGETALETLKLLLKIESKRLKNSVLPVHIRRYMPGYVWLKILSQTVDAFKKSSDTRNKAVDILHVLVNQNCHMLTKKGKWYNELLLIEMHHRKDAECSAQIAIEAFNTETLSVVDKVDLIERTSKIVKKKANLKTETKAHVKSILEDYNNRMMKMFNAPSKIIESVLMDGNAAGNKSRWLIESGTDQVYGSVESVAMHYYYNEGFTAALHCEGALPVVLFFTLFWEEIFNIRVPGAYVTEYQDSPLDLYFDQFYENRKERIDMKLGIVDMLNPESLSLLMETSFNMYSLYRSAMPSNLLKDGSQLKEIVQCLGVQGVVGICKQLIDDYKLWRAGFPDLIVWNFYTKKCKIVEVKGPRDTLSTKQRLWLHNLNLLGLDVEVCLVKDIRRCKS